MDQRSFKVFDDMEVWGEHQRGREGERKNR
jgi:hypothetical protein